METYYYNDFKLPIISNINRLPLYFCCKSMCLQQEFYPTNTLRNTGLKHVKTPFVFLVDVDFVPMQMLYQLLRDNVKSFGDLKQKVRSFCI